MSAPDVHLFEELTRGRLAALAPRALLVWPVGSVEQHGPHLPAGTDAMHAEWVARAAAARAAARMDIVLAPTLRFGSSAHHLPFGATISLATTTYLQALMDLTGSLIDGGFRRVFILNGHGGNHEIAILAARDQALARDAHVAAGSWWSIAWDALVATGAADAGRFPGHAGRFETSIMLAMRPELVSGPLPHRDDVGAGERRRYGGDFRAEHAGSWAAMDGWSDSPDLADATLGQRWLDAAVDAVAAALVRFQRESGGPIRE